MALDPKKCDHATTIRINTVPIIPPGTTRPIGTANAWLCVMCGLAEIEFLGRKVHKQIYQTDELRGFLLEYLAKLFFSQPL